MAPQTPLAARMQSPDQTLRVISFLGVLVHLGGAMMLIALFFVLRRFVLRRAYFGAWTGAWFAVALAIIALVVRYMLVPGIVGGRVPENHGVVRGLYLVYQTCKLLAFALFLRGTLMYVAGPRKVISGGQLVVIAALLGVVTSFLSPNGLSEMVIWQSAIAVPVLGYCASTLLWLPRPRRTMGSVTTGFSFALLAVLWLLYAVAFGLTARSSHAGVVAHWSTVINFTSYYDLALDVILGYSMILLLMEDARREMDDAQAELRVTHDQLRRAALYDSLTDSLNRRAFAEGVGLEMVRATFGAVVLADLDNLKTVNDRYGHAAGDRLLRRCADVLRNTLRSYDKLYRWGGDEFLLVVPSARAEDVMDRLRNAVIDGEIVDSGVANEPISLQVSLGAADYASSEELPFAIERADRAMYQEKSRRKSEPRALFTPPTSQPTAVARS